MREGRRGWGREGGREGQDTGKDRREKGVEPREEQARER